MHVQFSTHINPALPIVLRLNSINRTKVSRNGRQNAGLLIRIRWRQCSRRSPRNNLKQTTGTIRIFGSISTDPLVGTSLYKSIWIINGAFFIVGPHVAALGKSQTTIWTGIRLRSGMIVEMSLEMMLLREGLRAQGALVGLQTRMQTSVQSHIGSVGKGLVTDLTLIRPFSRMRPQMLLQQHLSRKCFAALFALVRLNPRVNSHVHVVRHSLIEALAAFAARVFLSIAMDLHMRAEVTPVVEVLSAFRTGRCKLPRTLVHTTMILVIPQLGELLAAVCTSEGLLAGVGPGVYL